LKNLVLVIFVLFGLIDLSFANDDTMDRLPGNSDKEKAFYAYPVARYHRIKKKYYQTLRTINPENPRQPMIHLKEALKEFERLYPGHMDLHKNRDVFSFLTPEYKIRGVVVDKDRDEETHIAIAGTEKMLHLILDMDIFPSYDPDLDIKLHSGFRDGGLEVLDKILPQLDKSRRIVITGHSLGGAVGLVVAMYLKRVHGFERVQVYTLGQPLVADRSAAQKFSDLEYYRVHHIEDGIQRLPGVVGYRHFGVEIELPGKRHKFFQDPFQVSTPAFFWHDTRNYHSSIYEIYRRVMGR